MQGGKAGLRGARLRCPAWFMGLDLPNQALPPASQLGLHVSYCERWLATEHSPHPQDFGED